MRTACSRDLLRMHTSSRQLRHQPPSAPLPSERRFGLVFSAVFAALAAYAHYRGWHRFASLGLLAAGAAFAWIGVMAPALLRPLNVGWFMLGQFLGRVTSPLVIGLLFFGLITPVALVRRALGHDELRLKRKPVATYWVDRTPPGPQPQSFRRQY